MVCLLGLASFVTVNLRVIDINDNEPELSAEDVFVCENDMKNTVRGPCSYNLSVRFVTTLPKIS